MSSKFECENRSYNFRSILYFASWREEALVLRGKTGGNHQGGAQLQKISLLLASTPLRLRHPKSSRTSFQEISEEYNSIVYSGNDSKNNPYTENSPYFSLVLNILIQLKNSLYLKQGVNICLFSTSSSPSKKKKFSLGEQIHHRNSR